MLDFSFHVTEWLSTAIVIAVEREKAFPPDSGQKLLGNCDWPKLIIMTSEWVTEPSKRYRMQNMRDLCPPWPHALPELTQSMKSPERDGEALDRAGTPTSGPSCVITASMWRKPPRAHPLFYFTGKHSYFHCWMTIAYSEAVPLSSLFRAESEVQGGS